VHEEPLRKEIVLDLLDETVRTLERDDHALRLAACDELGVGSADWASCRDQAIADLQEAEDWAEREDAIQEHVEARPPTDTDEGPDYLPSHQTLALFQSAMDERLEHTGGRMFSARDPQWVATLVARLKTRFTGRAPFVSHASPDDFRFPLAVRGRVALVSDWGTGNAHAVAVAQRIRECEPDHVIHLGDIYYAGTPSEVRRNFLDVWRAHGPRRARYWALNANHDMYSGGFGYFQHVLPALGQPASYFALGNAQWKLIGLDSAYVDHNFTRTQMDWLEAQVDGEARSILLTHHHLVSLFRKPNYRLGDWLTPFFDAGRLHSWFWGHDHYLVDYGAHRGVECRCIGHGGVPHGLPRERPRHDVPFRRIERRPTPDDPGRGIHGFALLTFDGPDLRIEYLDEAGGTSWTEEFGR
jgi:hypothetical protein